jgi:hypothetical protein
MFAHLKLSTTQFIIEGSLIHCTSAKMFRTYMPSDLYDCHRSHIGLPPRRPGQGSPLLGDYLSSVNYPLQSFRPCFRREALMERPLPVRYASLGPTSTPTWVNLSRHIPDRTIHDLSSLLPRDQRQPASTPVPEVTNHHVRAAPLTAFAEQPQCTQSDQLICVLCRHQQPVIGQAALSLVLSGFEGKCRLHTPFFACSVCEPNAILPPYPYLSPWSVSKYAAAGAWEARMREPYPDWQEYPASMSVHDAQDKPLAEAPTDTLSARSTRHASLVVQMEYSTQVTEPVYYTENEAPVPGLAPGIEEAISRTFTSSASSSGTETILTPLAGESDSEPEISVETPACGLAREDGVMTDEGRNMVDEVAFDMELTVGRAERQTTTEGVVNSGSNSARSRPPINITEEAAFEEEADAFFVESERVEASEATFDAETEAFLNDASDIDDPWEMLAE